MAEILEYKCPACGGAMEFDSASQKMKCPYCDTELEIEAFKFPNEPSDGKQSSDSKSTGENGWQEGETDHMRIYACQSCGAEIVADENTGASSCPFCGNQIVMKGQFEGDLKPDYIIPFKMDKKAAKKAYLQHLEGKKFLPPIFRQENHIDELKGIYVPFWLFDAKAKADLGYEAERIRTWISGDTEYTETKYYDVRRSGSLSFEKVPADGSKKMDDTLMEAIEPFDFSDAVAFKPAYLAGYIADRYDVTVEECKKRAKERIKQSTENAFKETVNGYHAVSKRDSHVKLIDSKYSYVLYPVWLLNTTWNNEKFVFAMNGQTGKLIGDLPLDKSAFWKYVAKWGVVTGVILNIFLWIFTIL